MKKLLWVCLLDRVEIVNQETTIYEECESRLRPAESADVAAGIGVSKR